MGQAEVLLFSILASHSCTFPLYSSSFLNHNDTYDTTTHNAVFLRVTVYQSVFLRVAVPLWFQKYFVPLRALSALVVQKNT